MVSARFGCRNAARLQKLTCRPPVSPNGTSGAASVLITRAEDLRDSQGGHEDGRSARFLLFAAPAARFSWLWNEDSRARAAARTQENPGPRVPSRPPVLL